MKIVKSNPEIPANRTSIRTLELDGLRGWASLAVLLYHVFIEMLANVVPELRSPLSYSLLNGQYAVFIFFILSGDALSSPFFAKGIERTIDRLVVKRYLRLTIPIFMSCFGVWLIIRFGLDFHREAAIVLGNEQWLGPMLQVEPSLYRLLKYVFYGVYAAHTAEYSYNPFLWTMSFEIIGSFIVFLFCYAWRSLRHPFAVLVFAACGLLILNSFYFLFLFGVGLSYARSRGWLDLLRAKRWLQLLALVAVPVLLTLIGLRGESGLPWPVAMSFCAVIVLSIYVNDWYRSFFSSSFSVFLGKISFPLYLTHLWVLIFPMSWLVLHPAVLNAGSGKSTYLVIGLVCIALALVIAWIFEFGERMAMRNLDRFLKGFVLQP